MTAGELTRVALLERRIGASLERIWENVLDWEHLPWLHGRSFASIELLDEGDWGWRARVGSKRHPGDLFVTELRVEREARRYVARSLEGIGAGGEIWTRLSPVAADATAIEVEFWLPDVPPGRAGALGEGYLALYAQLWDEDEAMMRRREAALAARQRSRRPAGMRVEIGALEALRATLPACFDGGGMRWRVLELGERLVAHSALCPHRLGPLEGECGKGQPPHEVRCPWHGYRFDLRSGRSADGRGLRLAKAPRVETRSGQVSLVWDD